MSERIVERCENCESGSQNEKCAIAEQWKLVRKPGPDNCGNEETKLYVASDDCMCICLIRDDNVYGKYHINMQLKKQMFTVDAINHITSEMYIGDKGLNKFSALLTGSSWIETHSNRNEMSIHIYVSPHSFEDTYEPDDTTPALLDFEEAFKIWIKIFTSKFVHNN